MPKFSQKSLDLLSQCHPDLQFIFKMDIEFYDCTILPESIRTKEQQAQFLAEGKSKTLNSMHLKRFFPEYNQEFSCAVDATPYPINFNNREEHFLFTGRILATADRLFKEGKISHRIQWGGRWKIGEGDLVHFELILD